MSSSIYYSTSHGVHISVLSGPSGTLITYSQFSPFAKVEKWVKLVDHQQNKGITVFFMALKDVQRLCLFGF